MVNKLQFKIPASRPEWLLLAGTLLMSLTHLRYGIDILAWISMVPFLVYLGITKGFYSRLLFSLALVLSWSIIVLKIITQPIPVVFVFLYSVPISLIHLPGYLLWAKFNDRKLATILFPAIMVLLEWIQYSFTPLGSWGAAAYTQVNSLIIVQFLSVFGSGGLGFMVYWMNAAIANYFSSRKFTFTIHGAPVVIVSLIMIFGVIRLTLREADVTKSIAIAAVATDSQVSGIPLPSSEKNTDDILKLFERTGKAAEEGAKIVVWNEAAFYLEKDYEASWKDSLCRLADEANIMLYASYVVPISESPFRFENKYLLINETGEVVDTYYKHEPVPGEPAIKGTDPLRTYNFNGIKLGGAICYDYDFPYLAKEYGELETDIVAVPSSDWRGIDPLHTKMAAFRAIEQGHSVLRSTRFGLSAAINPYGEFLAEMSSFDYNSKIMVAQLPSKGVFTIYSKIGDVLIYGCILFTVAFISFQYQNSRQALLTGGQAYLRQTSRPT